MKKWILVLFAICLLSGCGHSLRWPVYKPTIPQEISKGVEGTADLMRDLPKTFGLLVLVFVGGCVFWGFTKSKWGWVIPSSSVAGMWLMVTFARFATLIALLGVAVMMGILIWKAWEYQKERNENANSN